MDTKRCHYCNQQKPRSTFASKRKCYDCAANKTCKVCLQIKPLAAFSQFHGKVCRLCRKAYEAERYRQNKDVILTNNKTWKTVNVKKYKSQQREYRNAKRLEIRNAVLLHYGSRCDCCHEPQPLFLTIDHIGGNGWEHRRQIGKTDMWIWLHHNDYPDGFRILCFNCNAGRYRNGGVCPHKV